MQCSSTPEPELHRLIARGNIVTYRILIDWPAIISRCTTHPHEASWLDRRLRTALHSACTKRPPVDAIRALVHACGGKEIVERPDKHGRTPLVLAVESGSPESVVRLLLDIHPEAGTKEDIYGELPLHRACYNRASEAVVRMLLECNPEAAKKETKGGTPLDLAIESGASDAVIRMLIRAYPRAASRVKGGFTPLLAAIRKRATCSTIKAILEAHQSAASTEYRGNLPLHEAMEHHASAAVVNLLCMAHAEGVTHRNRIHHTPLHMAVKWNAPMDVVRVLLDVGPEVAYARHAWVKSPLELAYDCFSKTSTVLADSSDPAGAVCRAWERALEFLRVAYSGSVHDAPSNDCEWRVVHAAVFFRLPLKILKTVLEIFPNQVRQKDEDGRLPLCIASERGIMWKSGLELLFSSYPCALKLPDEKTKLYPFMLAAASTMMEDDLDQLETIYELLLAGPDMLCGHAALQSIESDLSQLNTIYELLLAGPDVIFDDTERGNRLLV